MKKVFMYIVYGFAVIGFVLVAVFFAVRYGLTNERGIIDMQRNSFTQQSTSTPSGASPWATTDEWNVLRTAITKDRDPIYKASVLMDIQPRLLVSIIMVEQMRLFFDDRELFKTVFAPLKILGIQSQFSWGVVGIKQETAVAIENNLQATTSPFYLGEKYEHTLDFVTDDHDKERFERLTDQHNRYYSYLYTAVYLKEIENQWSKAGYDISARPEILSTLFNIGFAHSIPNANPHSGGAEISIEGTTYSFGSLASQFYYSKELTDNFPK